MNQGWIYRDKISRSGAGQTVLDYYCQRYQHSNAEQWRERIESGQIFLDNRPTTPDIPLSVGQTLTYHRPPWQEPEVPLDFEIIYEDNDLLVINKPAGLPVLPGGSFLTHTLLHQLRHLYPQSTPYPLHRLGRGTSGLLLLARTPQARSHLSRQIRDRKLYKIYRTLIGACNLPYFFSIHQPIGKLPHPLLGYIYGATPDGKPAHSEVRTLKRSPDSTLLEVRILTGRPHQIRIHLAAVGYPLLGDPLYTVGGLPKPTAQDESLIPVPSDCGYWLHASQLTLTHPHHERTITFICPPPPVLS